MDHTVLPVKLQAANVRPFAYRILLKKHGLNVQTEALKVLTETLGLRFGSDWKGPSLHQYLETIAKTWKSQDRGLFIDGAGLSQVIAEISSSSKTPARNVSLDQLIAKAGQHQHQQQEEEKEEDLRVAGRSDTIVDVEGNTSGPQINDEANSIVWHHYFRVLSGDDQPKYSYDRTRKQFWLVRNGNPMAVSNQIEYFANRYNVVYDRLMRNESFQKKLITSFHLRSGNASESYQITLVKNLLGRSGQRFLLFGLLAQNENGDYSLEDKTDRITLSITQAYKNDGSYYCTGMFVIVEGIYSASGGIETASVGSGVGGCFHVSNMGQPSCERRDISLGAFGDLDFMGLQESEGKILETNHIMRVDRPFRKRLQAVEKQHSHKMIFLGVDCHLDSEKVMLGLKKLFQRLENELLEGEEILNIVFSGSFVLTPLTATSTSPTAPSSSAEYKNLFDQLAVILSKFPTLVSSCQFVFIPGSDDPWQSTFSMGGSSTQAWPQKGIPSVFMSRLARIIPKENLIAAWNPTRINYLLQEIAIMRDDITLKLKRNDIIFPNEVEEERLKEGQKQQEINSTDSTHVPTKVRRARKLVKTILDQGFMQPFKSDLKVIKPYYDFALRIEPLPTIMIINDATIGRFEVIYNGCKCINIGLLTGTSRALNYAEYMPSTKKVSFREVYF